MSPQLFPRPNLRPFVPVLSPKLGILLLGALAACSENATDLAREARMTALVLETKEAVTRSEEYGQGLEVLRAVRQSLQDVEGKTMLATSDGALDVQSLRDYHQWNSTAQGHDTPRAMDFEDPGHPIHAIVTHANELREQGVDYLYVLVPSRLELYPELLVSDLNGPGEFPGMNPGTAAFQAELARRGVECVPLLGSMAQNRFAPDGGRWMSLRTQAMLTPGGVILAAIQISRTVRAMEWFEQGPAKQGVDFQVEDRLISAPQALAAELEGLPGYEEPDIIRIYPVLTPEGLAAHVADPTSTIVLMGDAAVGFYGPLGGDLASQMYRILGQRLDVVLAPHGDHWFSFERRPNALEGKRLVIEVQSSGFRLPPTPNEPLPEQ